IAVAVFAVFFRSATIFLLLRFFESGMISYSGWKLFCTSTPRPFEGRSLICPIEAITTKSLPRYLLIVFALAGDSTMTRFLVITYSIPVTHRCLFDDRGLLRNQFPKVFRSGNENSTKYALNAKQPLFGDWRAARQRCIISPSNITFQESKHYVKALSAARYLSHLRYSRPGICRR